jgi:hypothetical protein
MAARRFVVCLALLAAGCGGGDSKPAPKAETTESLLERIDSRPAKVTGADDEIGQLLDERARALERGEIAAYAATAMGAQPARDRRAATRTAQLQLSRVRLVPGEMQTRGDRARVSVRMSYSVSGMRRPFRTPRRVELRRTGDGWRVARDVPAKEPLPWEVDSFRVSRAPHVVLLTPRGVDPQQLLPGLTRAYRDIARDLPRRDLPPSVLVIGARDAAQTERLSGRIGPRIVALADVSVEWGFAPAFEVQRVLAQRMVVVVSRWSAMPEADRQNTLAHEMTHTALNPDTSGRTPAWLVEGVAMYAAGEDRTAEAHARAAGAGSSVELRAISGPGAIGRLTGDEQSAAYAISSAAAHVIAARRGSKGLLALYDAFNDKAIGGRPGARTTDRVLRETLELTLAEVQAAATGG